MNTRDNSKNQDSSYRNPGADIDPHSLTTKTVDLQDLDKTKYFFKIKVWDWI